MSEPEQECEKYATWLLLKSTVLDVYLYQIAQRCKDVSCPA